MTVISKRSNLIGMKFNRLTVIELFDIKRRNCRWRCLCDCGRETIVFGYHLISGSITSCGCLSKENSRKRAYKHGDCKTKLYKIWHTMKARCYNKNARAYRWYGLKGVSVCSEWLTYINFKNWALDNGYKDGLSIDRIDSNGNYDPQNCQWITMSENVSKSNMKNNSKLKFGISPTGEKYEFYNVTYFAKEHQLIQKSISNVVHRKQKTHKGWKFGYVDEL